MGSVRLYQDQIDKIGTKYGGARKVIMYAIQRYESGEFKDVIQNAGINKNGMNVLRFTGEVEEQSGDLKIVPIRSIPDYNSIEIRAILDAHFAIQPTKCEELQRQYDEMSAQLAQLEAAFNIDCKAAKEEYDKVIKEETEKLYAN